MKPLLPSLLFLAVSIFPNRGYAPPPFSTPALPGTSLGKATSYWAAPYVKISEEQVGPKWSRTVSWYSDQGEVGTQSIDTVEPGLVITHEEGQKVIHGLCEPWKIVLPKSHDAMARCPLKCTENSHVLVDEIHSGENQVTLNIYLGGTPVNSIGPFIPHRGDHAKMGSDGSTALLVWKDATRTTPQIVTTDSKGNVCLRVDCDDTDQTITPTPDGAGALLQGAGATPQRNSFTLYAKEGKVRSIEISPNPHFIGWIPGTQKSLFSSSLGYDAHYRMIDWATGGQLWDIACPGGEFALTIGITPRLVIFEVAELYHPGPWRGDGRLLEKDGKEWIRAFYAVSPKDGHIVSHWRASYGSRLENYARDQIVLFGKKLYYVSADEFVELSEDDILNAKGGWER